MAAVRDLPDHGSQGGFFHHMEEFVRGIAFLPLGPEHRGPQGDARPGQEGFDGFRVKGFFRPFPEMVRVFEIYHSHDPPDVVLEIGIVEIHGPLFRCRGKGPQDQHFGSLRQERWKRMLLHRDPRQNLSCKFHLLHSNLTPLYHSEPAESRLPTAIDN